MAHLTDRHFAGLLAVRSSLALFEWTGDREARGLGTTHAQRHVTSRCAGTATRAGPPSKMSPPRWPSPSAEVQ